MNKPISLLLVSIFLSVNLSFAQEAKQEPKQESQMTGEVTKVEKESTLQERKGAKKTDGGCQCIKPAVEALERAYNSVEEDEWAKAIKTCKDSITAINTLAKTCKCPEVAQYQKVAEAFMKYAEGGNHLDGAEEPNCPYATKLYADTVGILKDTTDKIPNEKVKEYARSIKEYALEEQEFVNDECKKT